MAQKNMSLTKCPMPSLDPNYRNKVFEEVATGYTYEMAIEEARRCLNCKNKPFVFAEPDWAPIIRRPIRNAEARGISFACI